MFPIFSIFGTPRRRRNLPQRRRSSRRLNGERLEARSLLAIAAPGLEVTTYFSYTGAAVNGPTDMALGQGGQFSDDLYFTDNSVRRVYRLNDANDDHDATDASEGTLLYQFPIGSVDRPQNLIFGNGVGAWGNEMYLVDDGPNLMFRVSDNTGSLVISTFANFNIFGIPTPTGAAYTPDGQFMLVSDCQNFTVFGGGSDGRIYRVSQTGALTLWATGGNLPNGLWDNNSHVDMTSDGWYTVGHAAIGASTGPHQTVQFRDNNADGDALDAGEARILIGSNVPSVNKRIFALDDHDVLYISGGTKVFRLEDLNHDGDYYDTAAAAFDPDESTVVLDAVAGNVSALRFGPDGALYVGARETATLGRVYRLADANDPPTANPGGPYSVPEGGSISLNGAGSSDPDGSVAIYEWDFDYGDPTFNVDATGAAPAFSAAVLDGLSCRTIALRVIDNLGAISSIVTTTVEITNAAPAISSVSNDGPVDENSPVLVTVAATDPASSNDPLMYEFDFDNNGVFEVGPQAGNSATHTFADDGSYLVNVRVTDGDGGEDLSSTTVTVENVDPYIDSVSNDGTVDESSPVLVSVVSSDPAGSSDPLMYEFDFDNNGVFEVGPQAGNSATHTFADDGSYTVHVRVTDGDGGEDLSSITVTVDNVAPTGAADQATVSVIAGVTASNTGTYSDPADPVDLSASVGTVIDTGDGAWSWSWPTIPGGSQTVTIYGDDGAGIVAIASFNLIVNNIQAVAFQIGLGQINLNGNGVFPVTILSTPSFLVTNLDVATLRLSGSAAVHRSFSDLDNDGDLDLTLHFRRQDFVDEYAAALLADLADGTLDSNHQNVELTLTGKTTSGTDILGAAMVDMFMTGKKLEELLDSLGY